MSEENVRLKCAIAIALIFVFVICASKAWCANPQVRPGINPRPIKVDKKAPASKVRLNQTTRPATRKTIDSATIDKIRKNAGGATSDEPDKMSIPEHAPQAKTEFSEGEKVKWLYPNSPTAEIKDDDSFRLLVTIDGTVFQKETEDLYRLSNGSILISPIHKLVVHTPLCKITVNQGAVVTIDASSSVAYIRDFNDRWKGHVNVEVGSHRVSLMPGTELVVIKESDKDRAWKQAIRQQIRRRDLKPIFDESSIFAFKGEFSIPDAMLKSNHFKHLRDQRNGSSKAVIDEVTKTAALLHMTDQRGNYIILQP